MSAEKLVFIGVIVSPSSLNSLNIFTGFLAVENGKITGVGTKEEFAKLESAGSYSGFKVIKLSDDQLLLPGFVDCHTHAPQFPNLGLGLDRPLLEWLDKYTFPLESKYGDVEFARKVYDLVVQRLLTNGTTTACYFGSIHLEGTLELAKAAARHHQRALVGKVSINVENDAGYYNETQQELLDSEVFVRTILELDNDLVLPVVTPRFAVSCDETLMKGLSQISDKYGARIQSHISENPKEIEAVLASYPDCSSYAEVYDMTKLLNQRCILAHAVHLTEAEMRLLASRGVSVAHCPASNTRLSSGLCPVRKLLDNGITVGLATDVSGGDATSMLSAVRRVLDVSTHLQLTSGARAGVALTWTQALYLATLGGAKALNLADKIGSFEIGKDFDALLVDTFARDGPIDRYPDVECSEDRVTDLVQRFIYLGDDRNIVQVYVKGKLVKNTIQKQVGRYCCLV